MLNRMRVTLLSLVCVGALSNTGIGEMPRPRIDGCFGEWKGSTVIATDPKGDADGAFDLSKIWGLHCGAELYVSFNTGAVLNLPAGSDRDGTLGLIVGLPQDRLLHIDFRCRRAFIAAGAEKDIPWSRINFATAPTHASDRFELRLDLSSLGVKAGDRVTIQFRGSDELVDPVTVHPAVGADFRGPAESWSPERPASADVRIASLNTLSQGTSRPEASLSIKRLLAMAAADVYCFQEEWEEKQFRSGVGRCLDSQGGVFSTQWSGGCGIATTHRITRLPIKLERGIVAGIVRDKLRIVVASIHLKCCGFTGSEEDMTRVRQARELAARIADLRAGRLGTVAEPFRTAPVLVVGDYNLVGSRKPLEVLLRPEGPALSELLVRSPIDGSTITWRGGDRSEFWPGRLDWLTYDPSRLEPVGSFVFDSELFPEALLRPLGVRTADSRASDHLLLVADFRFLPLDSARAQ